MADTHAAPAGAAATAASTDAPATTGDGCVLVVDLGSQTTGLIAKALALLSVQAHIQAPPHGTPAGAEAAASVRAAFDEACVAKAPVAGIVLSGSPASVSDKEGAAYTSLIKHVMSVRAAWAADASSPSRGALVPVLAVCFGFQALSVLNGGAVGKGPGEYGPAVVQPLPALAEAAAADAWATRLHACLLGSCRTAAGAMGHPEEMGEGAGRDSTNGAGSSSSFIGAERRLVAADGGAGAGAGAGAATEPANGTTKATKPPRLHVWTSHGDDVVDAGALHVVASGKGAAAAAAASESLGVIAVQWHPEHGQTCDEAGVDVLFTFASLCGVHPRYVTNEERGAALLQLVTTQVVEDVARVDAAAAARGQAPPKFLVALSGGVDSAVAAGLVAHALRAGAGDDADALSAAVSRLSLCYVDSGLMRDEDAEHVARLGEALRMPVVTVDAQDEFFSGLAGVMDDKEVRLAVGASFGKVLARQRLAVGDTTLVVQGTLASDVVESTRIKAHHNVGGLPADLANHVFEPLRTLFKSDVRRLAAGLGLGSQFVKRRPFPGPGLALRVVGAEVNRENVALARVANAIWRATLTRHNIPHAQSIAAVCPPITFVGVRGDERTQGCLCMLRAVVTRDFMTAWPADIPLPVLVEAQSAIVAACPAIGRVMYDVTPKPPACVEFR